MATNFVRRKGHLSNSDQNYISQLKQIKTDIDSGISLTKLNKKYGAVIIKQAKADLHLIKKDYVNKIQKKK